MAKIVAALEIDCEKSTEDSSDCTEEAVYMDLCESWGDLVERDKAYGTCSPNVSVT